MARIECCSCWACSWLIWPPTLLSKDGNRAWTVAYQSTGYNETVLVSHDFGGGAWGEWFRSEDMRADWGSFYYAAIVLTE